MNIIQGNLVLEGEKVKLVPLDNAHFPALLQVAADTRIWEHISIDLSQPDRLTTHLKSAVLKRATGEQYPFTVIDKVTGNVIGCTLFHNIFPEHKRIEIGWTWYAPAYWRTGYNRECKLLLLTYCFETLGMLRVQFLTDENNTRSRDAILGIGATYEGTMRKERIRTNGTSRNTMVFSIINDEWPQVKTALQAKLR